MSQLGSIASVWAMTADFCSTLMNRHRHRPAISDGSKNSRLAFTKGQLRPARSRKIGNGSRYGRRAMKVRDLVSRLQEFPDQDATVVIGEGEKPEYG